MYNPDLVRRRFILGSLRYAAMVSATFAIGACQRQRTQGTNASSCPEPEHLSAAERNLRESLHYTQLSTSPTETCGACMFFEAESDQGSCGSCQILNGSVSRAGHCQSWTARS
jgi:hypothetical protein